MNGEMFPPMDPKGRPADMGESPVRDLSRRLRIIEERYSNLRKNIQVNEQNMLTESRKYATEIKTLNSEMSDIKVILLEMKEEMRMIIADVRESVKKEELKVLEKYINLWEPLNFVTPGEVERIVQKQLEKAKKESP